MITRELRGVSSAAPTGQYRAYDGTGGRVGQSCRVGGLLVALAVAQRHVGTQGGGRGLDVIPRPGRPNAFIPLSLPTQNFGRRSLAGWPLHTYDHRAFGPADPGGEAGGPADALHGRGNPGAAGRRGVASGCTRATPPIAQVVCGRLRCCRYLRQPADHHRRRRAHRGDL
jgi:hypothetical protein